MTATEDDAHLDEIRASYDRVAEDYERLVGSTLADTPFDRATLGLFAELTHGRVAEVGCGTGRVTAHLRGLGVDAFGVDLSAGMLRVARERHPGIRFEQGSMFALDLPDGGLGGAVLWYSTVHTPPALLPDAFAEMHRVLEPGGLLVHAYKAGDRLYHRDHAYGHPVDFDVHWVPPAVVEGMLTAAGFAIEARLLREPEEPGHPTQGPQAHVLARRPAAGY